MLDVMATPRASANALARTVWQTLFEVLIRSSPVRAKSLARRGLTANDSRALFSLDARSGRSMRALADEWECDPSNATWIIDRLETLGLARRRPLPEDKRVKLVVLTPKGRRTREALLDEFHQPPPDFERLDREDLEALERVLAKLTMASSPGGPPARG